MTRVGALLAGLLLMASPALATRVPFVGCRSDGQTGPQRAPQRRATPNLPPAAAAKLAFYAMANGPAVLGPRGWRCFGAYGSNGATLLLAPQPLDFLRTVQGPPIEGPAIQLSNSIGETSGRFEIAAIAAHVFPEARRFVAQVEAEGLGGPYPRGPFPADRITRRGPYRVLYTTPPNADGLGTRSHLARDPLPVDGIAIFDPKNGVSLTQLAARLPPPLRPLVAEILKDVAQRY